MLISNRTRKNRIVFRVSDEELDLIKKKMNVASIINREAYIRKMTLDGYIVRIDLQDVRRMIQLLTNFSGNINQIAKRINSTGDIFKSDITDIQEKQEAIWSQAKEILIGLTNIKN